MSLAVLSVMLVADMVLSSTYADSFNYSFYRALSFGLLAISMVTGVTFYLHRAENCVHFFRYPLLHRVACNSSRSCWRILPARTAWA